MPTDPFLQSPLRRLLSTTWPLFRAFGVRVRVSWTVAIWPLVFLLGFWSWMTPLAALGWSIAWTVGLFATVYTHEMGHIVAAWRYGVAAERITLRGLGGLAHMDSEAPGPREDIVIALAGPVTHLAWLLVLWPLELLTEPEIPGVAWWMLSGFRGFQLFMMLFNLIPLYPLDGGRTLRSAMALKMHANRASLLAAKIGQIGWIVLGLGALGVWVGGLDLVAGGEFDFLLLWIAIEGFFACRRLRFQAQHGDIFGSHDPYARVLQRSRQIEERAAAVEAKELARARAAREKRDAERARLQARVDALLDRINDVGMEGLSAAEREELGRASEELKRL